jgi:hypothetical protein
MADVERRVSVAQPLAVANRTVAQALASSRFPNVNVSEPALLVTAEARRGGQWTKDPVSVFLTPVGDSRTDLTIRATSTAQSLASLVSSPAKRNVEKVLQALSSLDLDRPRVPRLSRALLSSASLPRLYRRSPTVEPSLVPHPNRPQESQRSDAGPG